MTVIGAVGGRSETLYWVSSVVRRTCKEFVRQFIEKLVTRVPIQNKEHAARDGSPQRAQKLLCIRLSTLHKIRVCFLTSVF